MSKQVKTPEQIKAELAAQTQQLEIVASKLAKLDDTIKNAVTASATSMSEIEIIRLFNQSALDMFTNLISITTKLNVEPECNIKGQKAIFKTALKANAALPLDKFTLVILEYAAEIYSQDEDCFMGMTIPDTKVTVGNEFSMIRSDMFKELWKKLGTRDRERIIAPITNLTTYAHIHFYKSMIDRAKGLKGKK